ncbi:MAG: 50S ribosomal protein L2 [archaeon]
MGKRIIAQKRGSGTPSYTANTLTSAGIAKQIVQKKGMVIDIINSTGHSAPLLKMKYDDKKESLVIAAQGIKVGDILEKGETVELKAGNTLPVKNIPEGATIFNIEARPGDGGKLVRSSGTSAKIISVLRSKVTIKMPSGKQKELHPTCFATIGIVAGSGRTDKPFLKAGNKFKAMAAKGRYWPSVSGAAMNAVDHPFGGARSSRKGRPTIAPKNAPPGRKVGMIRPRHTGRNK